ncbi:MAG: AlwI family type II restriction endonuclease [Oscillospiraceae bacterium]|nr:AlwI family type II restriction endonuclease [Oscillospiraceae bacterium]MCL2279010.1 AlwI family type II restriction endonuclease [Oscillospiraceae bacterium]
MPQMVERNKWILYKHTCNYEMVKAVALDVKNACKTDISYVERHRMQERLAALDLYKTRNPKDKPLDSINHRINTLEYWMFGYEDKVEGEKRFIFSPLGNLFLKHINDEAKLKRIFLAMLFAFQFQHPGSGTHKEFQLYPFRLIFQLLLDSRLDGKLYNNEVEHLLVFLKSTNSAEYKLLVDEILKLRKISNEDMAALFKRDEHAFVNAVYEWEYYTQTLFEQIGVIERHRGDLICKLFHPSKTNSKSSPTGRKATRGFISIVPEQKVFVEKMLEEYSCFDEPIKLDDSERLYIDCVKEVYNFYPQLLLAEINESDEVGALLDLPKLIEAYANNPDNDTAYLFEDVLTDGFNMFSNVEAVKRGGSAHTDIECLYIAKRKKFAVESKSTANKLLGINAGRMREHREEIGGEYTIVVTPRYVPATKRDIFETPIVIVLASTFAEYLYNHIFHDIRDIDYSDFDDIITENLGTDISKLISNMTLSKFASNGK